MKAKKFTRETIRDIGLKKRKLTQFSFGDTIAVSQRIKEAGKERLQVFQGDVIAVHNKGISSTFTVRKIGAHGIAVERIYPYASPLIKSIKLVRRGDVRRAKLYYVRDRIGKAAQLKKLVETKADLKRKLEEQVSAEKEEISEETESTPE